MSCALSVTFLKSMSFFFFVLFQIFVGLNKNNVLFHVVKILPNFCAIRIKAENSREIWKFHSLSSKLSTGTVERF